MATQRELSRPQATSGAADLSAPGDPSSSAASFARYLRAANIAPATLKTYAEAVRTLSSFLVERGMPTDVAVITREHVEAFITDQLARWRPATAANRYRGLRVRRRTPPTSAPAHVRSQLARRRWRRERSHAPCRLAKPPDARSLRRECGE